MWASTFWNRAFWTAAYWIRHGASAGGPAPDALTVINASIILPTGQDAVMLIPDGSGASITP